MPENGATQDEVIAGSDMGDVTNGGATTDLLSASRSPTPEALSVPETQAAKVKAKGKKRKKKCPTKPRSAQSPQVALTVGDWLDVMDEVGVWNVAQVVSTPTSGTVEVRFQGYSDVENEIVSLESDCVAPFHTFTWTVKCWAKYLNWPFWPALLTVQSPGSVRGSGNLRRKTKVFVDFADHECFSKRTRCWVLKADVKPFEPNFDQFRKKTTGGDFEASLERVLLSRSTTKFPKFGRGTLPKDFESSTAIKSAGETRRSMGDALWLRDFANNHERVGGMFACFDDLVSGSEGCGDLPRDEDPPSVSCGPPLWTLFVDESDSDDHHRSLKRSRTRAKKPKTKRPKPEACKDLALHPDAVIPAREVAAKDREDLALQLGTVLPAREVAEKEREEVRSLRAAKKKQKTTADPVSKRRRLVESVDVLKPARTQQVHAREVSAKEREDPTRSSNETQTVLRRFGQGLLGARSTQLKRIRRRTPTPSSSKARTRSGKRKASKPLAEDDLADATEEEDKAGIPEEDAERVLGQVSDSSGADKSKRKTRSEAAGHGNAQARLFGFPSASCEEDLEILTPAFVLESGTVARELLGQLERANHRPQRSGRTERASKVTSDTASLDADVVTKTVSQDLRPLPRMQAPVRVKGSSKTVRLKPSTAKKLIAAQRLEAQLAMLGDEMPSG